jgi:hypothetical protein
MRGEDRSPALAFLDQQTILRQVRHALYPSAIMATGIGNDRFAGCRSFAWTRNQLRTATTGDRATREYTGSAELINCAGASHG